jgi:hypothetical protein
MVLRICVGVGVRVCVCTTDLITATLGGVFLFYPSCCVGYPVLFDYLSALVVRDHLPVVQAR